VPPSYYLYLFYRCCRSLIILKTAVGDANLTQSLEPESFAVGRSFTNRECPAPLQSDSNSRSCANLASRTAVSRIINYLQPHIPRRFAPFHAGLSHFGHCRDQRRQPLSVQQPRMKRSEATWNVG